MKISIIIPTFNEAKTIERIISFVKPPADQFVEKEVIVADGKSTDSTVKEAIKAGAKVINCSTPGRSVQMNCGAAVATGDIFYFYMPIPVLLKILKRICLKQSNKVIAVAAIAFRLIMIIGF
jgi:glycosyltransferase involved in cell wall biosynthesis